MSGLCFRVCLSGVTKQCCLQACSVPNQQSSVNCIACEAPRWGAGGGGGGFGDMVGPVLPPGAEGWVQFPVLGAAPAGPVAGDRKSEQKGEQKGRPKPRDGPVEIDDDILVFCELALERVPQLDSTALLPAVTSSAAAPEAPLPLLNTSWSFPAGSPAATEFGLGPTAGQLSEPAAVAAAIAAAEASSASAKDKKDKADAKRRPRGKQVPADDFASDSRQKFFNSSAMRAIVGGSDDTEADGGVLRNLLAERVPVLS